jgi:hypothetical protein
LEERGALLFRATRRAATDGGGGWAAFFLTNAVIGTILKWFGGFNITQSPNI